MRNPGGTFYILRYIRYGGLSKEDFNNTTAGSDIYRCRYDIVNQGGFEVWIKSGVACI
jgi:hypothetical protein